MASEDSTINQLEECCRNDNSAKFAEVVETASKEFLQKAYESPYNDGWRTVGAYLLCVAVQMEAIQCLRIILDYVSAKVKGKHDVTPLHKAAQLNSPNVAKVLLEHGAQVNATTSGGWSPIHQAANSGKVQTLSLLCSVKDAQLNLKTGSEGWTPLHIAVEYGPNGPECVRILLDFGASADIRDSRNYTAREKAVERGHQDILGLLNKAVHNVQQEPMEAEPAETQDEDAHDGWFSLQPAKSVEPIREAVAAVGVDQEDYDLSYPMSHSPHGLALIVNNTKFPCGKKDRNGSDVDAKSLDGVYRNLGFQVHTITNVTGQQLRDNLYSLAIHNHKNYDAVIVTILSHGIDGKIYGTDGDLVDVSEVTSYFKGDVATTLVGKPKLFVLQACRGGSYDYGIDSTDGAGTSGEEAGGLPMDETELFQKFLDSIPANNSNQEDETDGHLGTLPVEADMLMAYATVPGYVSFRNTEHGSWFIQALVKTLTERAHTEHLLDMLTIVNQQVATEFQSKGRKKQMPAPVTHLRKKLYFR